MQVDHLIPENTKRRTAFTTFTGSWLKKVEIILEKNHARTYKHNFKGQYSPSDLSKARSLVMCQEIFI